MNHLRTAFAALGMALLLTACDQLQPTEPALDVPDWAKVAPEQIAEAKKHGVPVAFENDLGMRFVLIPAGTYRMGASLAEQRAATPSFVHLAYDREVEHEVTISRPFYVQVKELTNAAYRRMVADHRVEVHKNLARLGEAWRALPINEDDHPAIEVSHDDAVRFAKWLSKSDAKRNYRLPTEAEWEYACRAGTTTPRYWGDGATTKHANTADAALRQAVAGDRRWTEFRPGWPIPEKYLWLDGNDGHVMTARVGTFAPNPWGLFDMLGNVAEWCADWYGPYASKAVTDPTGVSRRRAIRPRFAAIDSTTAPTPRVPAPVPVKSREPEPRRVVRGGNWYSGPLSSIRAARRSAALPARPGDGIGFRLVSPLPRKWGLRR